MMAFSLFRYIIIELYFFLCVQSLVGVSWPNYVLICYNSNVLQELY